MIKLICIYEICELRNFCAFITQKKKANGMFRVCPLKFVRGKLMDTSLSYRLFILINVAYRDRRHFTYMWWSLWLLLIFAAELYDKFSDWIGSHVQIFTI